MAGAAPNPNPTQSPTNVGPVKGQQNLQTNTNPALKAIGHSTAYHGAGAYIPYKPPTGPAKPGAVKSTKAPPPAGPTDWLAPQTQQQIQTTANSTISKAYAPQFQNLDQEAARQQAISAKRSSDNKYYANWLDTKMSALQSHADMANQQLMQAVGGQAQTLANAGQPGQFEAPAGGLVAGAQRQAAEGVHTQADMFNAVRANSSAYIQSAQQKQLSDLNTAMTKIADTRATAKTKETSDIAKEVARLTGVEIQKGQATRTYNAAVAKLGLTAAQLHEKTLNDAATQSNRAATNATTQRGQDLKHQIDTLNNQLGNANLNEKQRHDLQTELQAAKNAQNKLNTTANKGMTPYGVKAAPAAQQQKDFQTIDTLRGDWNQLATAGHSPGEIYNAMLNGGGNFTMPGSKKPFNFTPHDMHLVLAAQDLFQRNGRLSAGTADYLHHRGYMINGRWPVDAHGVGPPVPSVSGPLKTV